MENISYELLHNLYTGALNFKKKIEFNILWITYRQQLIVGRLEVPGYLKSL